MHRLRRLGILTALAVVIAACGEPPQPPEKEQVTLTVEVSGLGSGTVRFGSASSAVAVGETQHDVGSTVTLVAVPDARSKAVWGGACLDEEGATCALVLSVDTRVTVRFDLVGGDDETSYTVVVTMQGAGQGRVTSSADVGIACGDGTDDLCEVEVLEGTEVTLTAAPVGDSVFTGWGADVASCGTETTCTFTPAKDPFSVVAAFQPADQPEDPTRPAHAVRVNANYRDGVEWIDTPAGGAAVDVIGSVHTGLQYQGLAYMPRYEAEVANAFIFKNLGIPAGATVTRAYIQFTSIERAGSPASSYAPSSGPASPTLRITLADTLRPTLKHRPDDPADGPVVTRAITNAPRVAGDVVWTGIPDWTEKGVSGEEHRTADVSALLQQLVDRPEWSENGDVMFIIENASADAAAAWRQIATHNWDPAKAPVLWFDYELE